MKKKRVFKILEIIFLQKIRKMIYVNQVFSKINIVKLFKKKLNIIKKLFQIILLFLILII